MPIGIKRLELANGTCFLKPFHQRKLQIAQSRIDTTKNPVRTQRTGPREWAKLSRDQQEFLRVRKK